VPCWPWGLVGTIGGEGEPMRAYRSCAYLGWLRSSTVDALGEAGATQEAFMRDRFVCLQQTPLVAGNYNTTLFAACMGTRGYKEDANGNLLDRR